MWDIFFECSSQKEKKSRGGQETTQGKWMEGSSNATLLANLLEDIRTTKQNLAISSDAIATAQASFNTHYTTFLTLANQLEVKFKEIELRESAREDRENEATKKLQERESKCEEKEQRIAMRKKEMSAHQQKWNEIEQMMLKNATQLPTVIRFNVSM